MTQFLTQFLNVLAQVGRFSITNRLVSKLARTLFEMLPSMWNENGVLEFVELHGTLFANNAPITQEMISSDTAFLFVLVKNNVRRLRLESAITEVEFNDLLHRLATSPAEGSKFFTTTHEAFGPHIKVELQVPLGDEVAVRQEKSIPRATETVMAVEPPHTHETKRGGVKTVGRASSQFCVQVIVRIGVSALFGAEVSWADSLKSVRTTEGEQGALLFAPPGRRELMVLYDKYQFRKFIQVREDNQRVEINLQQSFEDAEE